MNEEYERFLSELSIRRKGARIAESTGDCHHSSLPIEKAATILVLRDIHRPSEENISEMEPVPQTKKSVRRS
jgi:hypothetical protein